MRADLDSTVYCINWFSAQRLNSQFEFRDSNNNFSVMHAYAQQNFRIFWVGIPFRVNIDYILWIANVCEFLSMSTKVDLCFDCD